MFEDSAKIYENRSRMLKKINRESYIERMEQFREEYGSLVTAMLEYIGQAEDSAAAGNEIGKTLVDGILRNYCPAGKKTRYNEQVDITMFTVYYVFPAILLTASPDAEALCDGIKAAWPALFEREIDYTTYENLRDSFRETILGIPFGRKKKNKK